MADYVPLIDNICVTMDVDDAPFQVKVTSVEQMLREISPSKSNGPDRLPNWILKTYICPVS